MPSHKDIEAPDLHELGYRQASDPGAVGAGKVWHDTDDDTVYIRNTANSGWLRLLTGTPTFDAGTTVDSAYPYKGLEFATDKNGGGGQVHAALALDWDGALTMMSNIYFDAVEWEYNLYDTAKNAAIVGTDSDGRFVYYFQKAEANPVDPLTLAALDVFPDVNGAHVRLEATQTNKTLYLVGGDAIGLMARGPSNPWNVGISAVAYAGHDGAGGWVFYPSGNGAVQLGLSGNRWSQVWCTAGAFNGSDERLKDWRGGLNEAEARVAQRLSAQIGIYQMKAAVATKGKDGARLHTGVIAQRVIEAFEAEGLDWHRYGLIGYDEWAEQREVRDVVDDDGKPVLIAQAKPKQIEEIEVPAADGKPVRVAVLRPAQPAEPAREEYVAVEAGDGYSIRYDELAMFMIAGMEQRMAALEGRRKSK